MLDRDLGVFDSPSPADVELEQIRARVAAHKVARWPDLRDFAAARVAEGVTSARDGSSPSRVIRELRRERLIIIERRTWLNVSRHGGRRRHHYRPFDETLLCGIDDGHCYVTALAAPPFGSAREIIESLTPPEVHHYAPFARAGELHRQGDVHLVSVRAVERAVAAHLSISRQEVKITLRAGRGGVGGHRLPRSHRLLSVASGLWLVHDQHPPLALGGYADLADGWVVFTRRGVGCGD